MQKSETLRGALVTTIALLLAAALIAGGAEAQEGSTPVSVSGERMDAPTSNENDEPLGEWLGGSLTVYADGAECATMNLIGAETRSPDGNPEVSIGGADQPAACGAAGATISFRVPRFGDEELVQTYTLEPGVPIVLDNFAPPAPDSGPPGAPDVGTGIAANEGGRLARILAALGAALLVGSMGVFFLARRRAG